MAGERFRIETFESLTRKHDVECVPPSEVELNDVFSIIGNIVGSQHLCCFSHEYEVRHVCVGGTHGSNGS